MLGSIIREIIAPVLRECPPECGIVSITRVDVSDDFSYATAYVSALMRPDLALEFLERQTVHLQRSLGRLERRKIPHIRFRLDQQEEQASRIDALLG